MLTQTADNTLKTVKEVTDLKTIRATQFAGFLECPKSWWLQTTERVTRPESPWAKTGTAVHAVIERYLRKEFELYTDNWLKQQLYLEEQGVSDKERRLMETYLRSVEEYRERVLGVELSVVCPVFQGIIPLSGHLDLACTTIEDGTLLIVDHKTNRQFEGPDQWKRKIQPRVYAFMARRIWPQFQRVLFEIGYVNLETKVRWETDPQDDVWLAQRFWEAVQEINVYHRHAEWPERVGQYCGFCPAKESCQTFKRSLNTLRDSILRTDGQPATIQRYLWLETVLKAGQQWMSELKSQLLEAARESGGKLEEGPNVAALHFSSRRVADFVETWDEMSRLMLEEPDSYSVIMQHAPEIFSVKVGGLDKLVKECPSFKPIAERLIRKVRSEEPTVEIKPK